MTDYYDLKIMFMDDRTMIVPKITRHYVHEGVLRCMVEHRGSYYADRKCVGEFPIQNIRMYQAGAV